MRFIETHPESLVAAALLALLPLGCIQLPFWSEPDPVGAPTLELVSGEPAPTVRVNGFPALSADGRLLALDVSVTTNGATDTVIRLLRSADQTVVDEILLVGADGRLGTEDVTSDELEQHVAEARGRLAEAELVSLLALPRSVSQQDHRAFSGGGGLRVAIELGVTAEDLLVEPARVLRAEDEASGEPRRLEPRFDEITIEAGCASSALEDVRLFVTPDAGFLVVDVHAGGTAGGGSCAGEGPYLVFHLLPAAESGGGGHARLDGGRSPHDAAGRQDARRAVGRSPSSAPGSPIGSSRDLQSLGFTSTLPLIPVSAFSRAATMRASTVLGLEAALWANRARADREVPHPPTPADLDLLRYLPGACSNVLSVDLAQLWDSPFSPLIEEAANGGSEELRTELERLRSEAGFDLTDVSRVVVAGRGRDTSLALFQGHFAGARLESHFESGATSTTRLGGRAVHYLTPGEEGGWGVVVASDELLLIGQRADLDAALALLDGRGDDVSAAAVLDRVAAIDRSSPIWFALELDEEMRREMAGLPLSTAETLAGSVALDGDGLLVTVIFGTSSNEDASRLDQFLGGIMQGFSGSSSLEWLGAATTAVSGSDVVIQLPLPGPVLTDLGLDSTSP